MTEVRLVEQPKRNLRKLTGPSNKIKLNLDRLSTQYLGRSKKMFQIKPIPIIMERFAK